MSLTQPEFEHLIRLKKEFKESTPIDLGPHPIEWHRDIISLESKDAFILDYRRASIEIKKFTYNTRFRTSIVLLRYCSQVKHTNPPGTDEQSFAGPHIHLYREGFDAKWAFPVSELGIKTADSHHEVLNKILDYCNIQNRPNIVNALF